MENKEEKEEKEEKEDNERRQQETLTPASEDQPSYLNLVRGERSAKMWGGGGGTLESSMTSQRVQNKAARCHSLFQAKCSTGMRGHSNRWQGQQASSAGL